MVYLKGRDLSNIWLIEISRKCFSENSETLMRTKNLKLNPKKFSKSWDYLIFISTVLPQIKIIFFLFWGTWNPGIGWGGGFNSHFALFLYFFFTHYKIFHSHNILYNFGKHLTWPFFYWWNIFNHNKYFMKSVSKIMQKIAKSLQNFAPAIFRFFLLFCYNKICIICFCTVHSKKIMA